MGFGDRRGFHRKRDGTLELRLDPEEAAVLADLLGQVQAMVEPEESQDPDPLAQLVDVGPGERPADPAMLRLFPDGYSEDDDASADFRRFTERRLRESKAARLAVADAVLARVPRLGPRTAVVITAAEAGALLGSLNDVRLVLGVRLGIERDDQDVTQAWAPEDPRWVTYTAYQWLTWLQSSLLDCLGNR